MILIFNNIMQIVFMKKKYTGSMAILLCLALTACAKTPEQALVAHKNNERLEEAAKEGPKDGNSLKDIAAQVFLSSPATSARIDKLEGEHFFDL